MMLGLQHLHRIGYKPVRSSKETEEDDLLAVLNLQPVVLQHGQQCWNPGNANLGRISVKPVSRNKENKRGPLPIRCEALVIKIYTKDANTNRETLS